MQKCIKMQFLFVFPNVRKIANFWWKNADASRNQGVFHVIYIFFGSSLGKVYVEQVSSLWTYLTHFK